LLFIKNITLGLFFLISSRRVSINSAPEISRSGC